MKIIGPAWIVAIQFAVLLPPIPMAARAQDYDPAILEAECRTVPRYGCVCVSVVEDPMPFAQFAFLVRMYQRAGTWLTPAQKWFEEWDAERLLARAAAECRRVEDQGGALWAQEHDADAGSSQGIPDQSPEVDVTR